MEGAILGKWFEGLGGGQVGHENVTQFSPGQVITKHRV